MTKRNDGAGILLFAHGSSVEEANRGVHELAQRVEEAGPYGYVRAAFLEWAQPDLATAVRQAAEAGLRRVVIVPYFLTMGVHLLRDLPGLVSAARKTHPDFNIEVGQSLEGHPLMPSIILGRAREVLEGTQTPQ